MGEVVCSKAGKNAPSEVVHSKVGEAALGEAVHDEVGGVARSKAGKAALDEKVVLIKIHIGDGCGFSGGDVIQSSGSF